MSNHPRIALAPKISVVVISYNNAKYLRETIESVLAQTLPPFEIIICDDHSTDESWAIISKYSERYPELIKPHRHERNTGIGHNLNSGIEKARGDLVTCTAGDDRFLPRKLELEWKALQSYPEARVAYSNIYNIDVKGNRTGVWYEGKGAIPPSGDVFVKVFSKQFFPNTRSLFRNELVYRTALSEVSYDENLEIYEDWDFKIRLAARFPVIYSGEALVEYRIHDQGMHNLPLERHVEAMYAVYRKNLPLLASRSEQEAAQVKREVEDLLMSLLSSKPWGWEVAFQQPRDSKPARQSAVVPTFLVNSLPQAGTNLLAKAVGLVPGIRPAELHIGQSTHAQLRERDASQEMKVPIGVDWPQPISLNVVEESLQKLENGHYATTHIPFSEQLASLLTRLGLKTLLILRDPRDVVVSHARYVVRRPDHFLFELYQELPESERIMISITGVNPIAPGRPMLLNIRERCLSVLPWALEAFNYTTYFEKLVGPQGGGTRKAQIEELENVARHLGLQLQRREVEQIADQVFGGTHTFRKGAIGNWQNHFSPEHKRVFKELAGQLLVDLGYEQDFDW